MTKKLIAIIATFVFSQNVSAGNDTRKKCELPPLSYSKLNLAGNVTILPAPKGENGRDLGLVFSKGDEITDFVIDFFQKDYTFVSKIFVFGEAGVAVAIGQNKSDCKFYILTTDGDSSDTGLVEAVRPGYVKFKISGKSHEISKN